MPRGLRRVLPWEVGGPRAFRRDELHDAESWGGSSVGDMDEGLYDGCRPICKIRVWDPLSFLFRYMSFPTNASHGPVGGSAMDENQSVQSTFLI